MVDYELSDTVGQWLQTEVISIPEAGHLPHLEQPDLVHSPMLEFLSADQSEAVE